MTTEMRRKDRAKKASREMELFLEEAAVGRLRGDPRRSCRTCSDGIFGSKRIHATIPRSAPFAKPEIGEHCTHFFSIRQGRFESVCQLTLLKTYIEGEFKTKKPGDWKFLAEKIKWKYENEKETTRPAAGKIG